MLARARRFILASAVLACAAVPASADDWADCLANVSDKLIAGCSAVIEQRTRSPADLVRAYTRRAEWYRGRNMLDKALADLDQAVTLDPKSFNAVAGRGVVYRLKSQLDQAQADFERAI
jgi:Tfp pilus assembly protein PilF